MLKRLPVVFSVLIFPAAMASAGEMEAATSYGEVRVMTEAASLLGDDGHYDAAISLYTLLLEKYPEVNHPDAYEPIGRAVPRKIEALKCAKNKGGETVFDSPKAFFQAIREAVREKKKDRLERYYSCGFGVCSDSSQICWLVEPATAAAIMTGAAGEVDWSKPDLIEEAVRVGARKAGSGYKFEFKKVRQGWKWTVLTFEDSREPLAMEKRFYDAYIVRSTATPTAPGSEPKQD